MVAASVALLACPIKAGSSSLSSSPGIVTGENYMRDDIKMHGVEEEDEILQSMGMEALAEADLASREKPTFRDRSTPPLWNSNSTIEIVATLPDAPFGVAIEHKSGRLFYSAHPYANPDLDAGEGLLNEWITDEGISRPFPSPEFQKKYVHKIAAIAVDNIRGWLIVLDSHPFEYHQEMRIIVIEIASEEIVHRYTLPYRDIGDATGHAMVLCPRSQFIYIANSGVQKSIPSLIVVDIHIWRSWSLLKGHESVAHRSVLPILNNQDPIDYPWLTGLSSIAVDSKNDRLVFGSMFGDYLYSLSLKTLRGVMNPKVASSLGTQIQQLGPKTISDGIVANPANGDLYISDFEHSAVTLIEPTQGWSVMTLVQDSHLLRWPSSIVIANHYVYVACSAFDKIMDGDHRLHAKPFHILRFPVYDASSETKHDEL